MNKIRDQRMQSVYTVEYFNALPDKMRMSERLKYCPFKMKWHRLNVGFLLLIGETVNIISGLLHITGKHHVYDGENLSDELYETFWALQALDVVIGLLLIIFGVGLMALRGRLVNFKANAVQWVCCIRIFCIALTLSYGLIATSIIKAKFFDIVIMDALFFGRLAVMTAWVIIDSIYYSKRKAIFVK